ncbi:hypothetical protein AeMF1_016516 [Aphanomyces euteiches]|nr:hypothetical protein AeMF1_016516 [Aphanomyces euteiches]
MFVDILETHRSNLRKTPTDRQIVDVGEGGTQYPESWDVIMDKGYEGVDDAVRSIRPKKKPRGSILSRIDIDRNERVSSDRMIVENLFGQTCKLWKISYATFKSSESKYDVVQRLSFALTNFHLSMHPIRTEDRGFYTSVLARYHSMAEDRALITSERLRRYFERRQERIDASRAALARRSVGVESQLSSRVSNLVLT